MTNTKALVVGNPIMPEVTIANTVEGTEQELISLPGAEKEARTIAQILNTKPLLGKDATETEVTNRISEAKIVHFATHGVLNAKIFSPQCQDYNEGHNIDSDTPYNSTIKLIELCQIQKEGIDVLAFTPSDQDDGLLDEAEIYGLDLNANLIVLSACDTGLGETSTEGVIGLARPFLINGVPTVVASLWSVPDSPTAELMVEFYQNLESNPNKAQALRQAMLTIKEKYPEPYNWAAFTLIGKAI